MERRSMMLLFVGLFVAGHALKQQPKLSPPLKDGESDKKFFGPPFPANYPEDKRPVPDKAIMDKVRGPGQAYPALQSKEDYDSDYVKDENSDTGAWQAQFEYDALRKKLADEEAAEKRAKGHADRAGAALDGAQRDADAAAKRAADAAKDDLDAAAGQEEVKTADDFGGPPSAEKLEELKKAVKAAEEKLADQKKAFAKCEQELATAKKELEDLKAAQVELEKKLAADTKLWIEQKTQKFNLKKTKQSAATAKVIAARAKLDAAEKIKAVADKALAKEKAEHEKAQAHLHKEKTEYHTAQKQLDAASSKLQKLHGYKPVQAAQAPPTKSGGMMDTVSKWFR